jgi:acyl-CoA thioester hydrolase
MFDPSGLEEFGLVAYRFRCPLRWGDMDAQGHVNNAAFLDYLQEARVHYLLNGPSVMGVLLETGVLVVSHQLEYLHPVIYSDRGLEIELWVTSVGASRFGIGYDVRDQERLVARARTSAVPFDLAGNALRRLSAEEREVLVSGLRPSENFAALPAVPPGRDGYVSPLSVRWSDLDSYGHVNNVKYFEYLQQGRVEMFRLALGDGELAAGRRWAVVRQDLDYRRPLDFRPRPYAIRTVITAFGNRSVSLGAEIVDPDSDLVFAVARTVLVGGAPLTDEQRTALRPFAAQGV